jgi:hypothetical protein
VHTAPGSTAPGHATSPTAASTCRRMPRGASSRPATATWSRWSAHQAPGDSLGVADRTMSWSAWLQAAPRSSAEAAARRAGERAVHRRPPARLGDTEVARSSCTW